MAAVLIIAGVEKSMQNGWSLRRSANARGTLQCNIISIGGVYRPAMNQVTTLTDNGALIYGGYISGLRETGIGGETWSDIVTDVTVVDNNAIAERRHLDGTIPTGTLKAALTAIVAILTAAGGSTVTLHASQVDGPTIPELIYDTVRLDAALNDLTSLSGGWPWEIDENNALRMQNPTLLAAPFNILATNSYAIGDVEVEPSMEDYSNTVIVKSANFRKDALDGAGRTTYGAWESVYTAPDDASETAMQELADSILARSLPIYKRVQYRTLTPGLKPRQTQTITLAHRNVNNTFLIMEVDLRQAEDGIHYYHVTAIEGVVYRTDWRAMYRRWSGTVGSVSGGVITGGGGGGGGSAVVKRVYPIGGSGLDFVRSATPTWVSATSGAVQAQIDTVEIGTTSVVVKAMLRALDAGVSVQARLFDKSTSTACAGLSAVVTDTAWTAVAFTATLTAGEDFYELQLLPGTANADVGATGYVEN